jgi:sugar transferase EpsL
MVNKNNRNRIDAALKRAVDFAGAAGGLLALAPLIGTAALAVRATMGRPVFFRQERPGIDGEPFELIKFRTMRHPWPGEEGPECDEARLTRLGRLLRSTSIDELPTLINVVRGEMSLVGPRPLLMRYNERYSSRQARRLEVRPGITGWAQVNGRNNISWARKFELDVFYVENGSTALDIKILIKTVLKVLEREGISQDGCATMPEFTGREEDSPKKSSNKRG